MENPFPTYLTPADLMKLLGGYESQSAFMTMVRQQGIPRRKINSRVIRFEWSEVEKWLKRRARG
jgi:predicted DNA-binding transcriptional regulator AlpA